MLKKKKLGIEGIEREWSLSLSIYYKISSTLIIPEGCEKIGFAAFRGCKELKSVVIPGNVKTIQNFAFKGCDKLERVEILEGVEGIGFCAFRGCSRLEKVVIPGSVEWIVDRSFEGCVDATVILEKPRSEYKFIGRYRVFDDVKDVKEEIRA